MLLSSVATAMFWTGRYVERAQALSRVLLSYERLSLDLPASRQLELRPLFELAGRAQDTSIPQDRSLALRQLVFDTENPSSVLGALLVARENLRQARVVAPVELWTTLSSLAQTLKEHEHGAGASVLQALEGSLSLGHRFEGERRDGMTHDTAYAFLELGSSIERADMQVRCLGVLLPALLRQGWERAFDDVRWTGLLHAVGLHSAYRRLHHHQAELPKLFGLALSDPSCPRSVMYCLRAMEQVLRLLPRAGQVRDQLSRTMHAAVSTSKVDADSARAELPMLLGMLEGLSVAIEAAYFPGEQERQAAAPVDTSVSVTDDPFEHLGRDHAQVDAVLRVLEALVLQADNGASVDVRELQTIVAFLTDCGELGHHEKEETILTPVLVARGFDWYQGPLANMRREHRQEHYFIRVLSHLASQREKWSREEVRSFSSVAREFCHFLSSHMDHERQELFQPAARTLPTQVKSQLCKAFEELDARQGPQAAGSRLALGSLIEKYRRNAFPERAG